MEINKNDTPQKLTHKFFFNYQANRYTSSSVRHHKVSPNSSKCIKKAINPRTPRSTESVSYSVAACSSLMSGSSSSAHSISMAAVESPPAKRFQKVKNPFEAALTERLHLPLIASPSLFQRPNTTQMSSTEFEWTIDEVSSINPANVEPHETQFQESPDPELEAKAQSAISSYFKEHQIVPSPIDCSLRSQRIILSEINGNTPLSKPGRRIRDSASQTELTLPPILPPALEEALKPYFQPQLAGVDVELSKCGDSRSWHSSNSAMKDTSLRRKLFDMHNIVVLDNDNQKPLYQPPAKSYSNSAHSNSSPISIKSLQHTAIVGKLSDSDKSSFGSLSPISASDSLSPNCLATSATKRKTRIGNFFKELEDVELLSPICPPVRRKPLIESTRTKYRNEISRNDLTANNSSNDGDDNERFTPERSSSPLNRICSDNLAEFSTDSVNIKVSRLNVNSSNNQSTTQEKINKNPAKISTEIDIFQNGEIEDMLENTADMDDIHASQLSGHSSNCSSSHSDTPRGKRRSASRKNLSQSFSANWPHDENDQEVETSKFLKMKEILTKKQLTINTDTKPSSTIDGIGNRMATDMKPKENLTFYRTDSGFNEMCQNSTSCETVKSQEAHQTTLKQQDVLVCSTPSTKDNINFIG